MKQKIILFLTLCLLCFDTLAQIAGQNGEIPCRVTAYNNPTSDPWWYDEFWEVYASENSSPSKGDRFIKSPFYTLDFGGHDNVTEIAQPTKKDYKYEDGWRFIKKRIGASTQYIDNPHFVFYNIYTAKVRILIYTTNCHKDSGGGKAFVYIRPRVGISHESTAPTYNFPSPNTLTELSSPTEVVEDKAIDKVYTIPVYWENRPNFWVVAEFPVTYDPCTCIPGKATDYTSNPRLPIVNVNQQAAIDFSFHVEDKQVIEICNFNKREDDTCSDILSQDPNDEERLRNRNIISSTIDIAKNIGSTAKDIGNAIPDFQSAFVKIFKPALMVPNNNSIFPKFQIGKFLKYKKAEKVVFNIADVVDKVSTYALLTASGIEMVAPILGLFTGKDKQTGGMGFQPYYSKGTITSLDPKASGNFLIPGSYHSQYTQQKEIPEYDNVMGIMSVLRRPILSARYSKKPNLISVYKARENRTDYEGEDYTYYYEVDQVPQIVVNPALDIDLSQSEINISYEFDEDLKVKTKDNNSSIYMAENLDFLSFKQGANGKPYQFYASPLFPLNCIKHKAMIFTSFYYKRISVYPYGSNTLSDYWDYTPPTIEDARPKKAYMKVVARLRPRSNTTGSRHDDIMYVNRYLVDIDYNGKFAEPQRDNMIAKLYSENHRNEYVTYTGWNSNNYPVMANQELTLIGGINIPANNYVAGKGIEVVPLNANAQESYAELKPGTSLGIDITLDPTGGWACDRNSFTLLNAIVTDVKKFCTDKSYSRYAVNHNLEVPTSVTTESQASSSDLVTDLRVFPNPASGTNVEMAYSVSEKSDIKISVLGAKGEKVTELVQEIKDAGKYDLVWNITQIPNGLYFCIMEVNGKRIVKRLVIQK